MFTQTLHAHYNTIICLHRPYTPIRIPLFVYTDLTRPLQYHYLFTQTLHTHYNTIICLHRPCTPITIPLFVYTDPTPRVEKIFSVTRIKNYPYFYDPFLPNSSRALRNFKNLCAVPAYTRNGAVTAHVIKLLLLEKIPFYCSQLTFFSPYFPKFFLMTFFLGVTSFFTSSINFSLPPKNFYCNLLGKTIPVKETTARIKASKWNEIFILLVQIIGHRNINFN